MSKNNIFKKFLYLELKKEYIVHIQYTVYVYIKFIRLTYTYIYIYHTNDIYTYHTNIIV